MKSRVIRIVFNLELHFKAGLFKVQVTFGGVGRGIDARIIEPCDHRKRSRLNQTYLFRLNQAEAVPST